MRTSAFVTLLTLVALGAPGCTNRTTASEELCADVYDAGCAFKGGRSKCESSFQEIEDQANARGCGVEIENLYGCVSQHLDVACDLEPEAACPLEAAALKTCDSR